MYKIGDFSQLGQVTVRTLRHYDRLGLLTPGHIDQFTNYRYYTADQLPRLNRILALRDLGFSLEDIGQMIDENPTVDDMRSLLIQKQQEIEAQLREESARLQRVAARLRQIERDGQPLPYDVVVKPAASVSLLSVRDVVPNVEVMNVYRSRLYRQLYTWLAEKKIPYGREIVTYHNRSYSMENIEMSIGVEVDSDIALPLNAPENMRELELPATSQAASIIYNGSILEIPDVVTALYGWSGVNSYSSTGPYREIHLFGREIDALAGVTVDLLELKLVYEILLPIERF